MRETLGPVIGFIVASVIGYWLFYLVSESEEISTVMAMLIGGTVSWLIFSGDGSDKKD